MRVLGMASLRSAGRELPASVAYIVDSSRQWHVISLQSGIEKELDYASANTAAVIAQH